MKELLDTCLNTHPMECFRICLPPRGKCRRKGLPVAKSNVNPSQRSTIRPERREQTHAVWRTLCPATSHDPRKERLCSLPMGTQRTMMMCLIPHHVQLQRQSRMAKCNGPSIRHATTMARPNGQRTQWTRRKAKANTPRPKSPTAHLAPDTPRLPILPGERRNVHEPLEAHHEVLRLTQNVKAGRALVGGKIQTCQVLQIAVRLKTMTTSIADLNTH